MLERTAPQLAPLLQLLADLCGRLEEDATTEAVADLAEAARRLSGAQLAAPPAVAALVQTLAEATAGLLRVAAPSSPVRDKVRWRAGVFSSHFRPEEWMVGGCVR